MLEFRQFEIDDIELAKNAIDTEVLSADRQRLLEYANFHKNNGSSFTGLLDGKPVMVAGIQIRHKDSGLLWSIFSKDILNHKLTVFKSIKLMLECFITNNNLKKIVAETRVCFPESQRLMEHLGFIRQRRTFNKDYVFYKKVI